jgi:hypothetical protein
MLERPVDTPTLKKLKALRQRRLAQPYVYRLTDEQVLHARRQGLPDSALLALAAISAAAYGARGDDWVTLPARTVDAIGRGYRWWHRATDALQTAGLLECRRHVGRLPRYRLATLRFCDEAQAS